MRNQVALPVVAALSIATVAAVIWLPDSYVVRYFHDDAFFVLKTASHLGSTGQSTFDGINPTNGYHPLNLWLFSLVSVFVPIKGGLGLDAVIVINMAMTGVGLVLIDNFIKRAGFHRYARFFVLLGVASLLAFNDFGLEARLLLPMAWLLLVFALRSALTGKTSTMAFGVLAAGVILTRLDAFIFVVFIALFVSLWQTQPLLKAQIRATFTRLVLLLLPSCIAILGYAIYNWVVFSKPMTVSSWLKFGWSSTLDPGWLHQPGAFIRVGLCLGVPVAFFLAVYVARHVPTRRSRLLDQRGLRWLLSAANAYNVIYVFIVILFLRGEFGSWYVALPLSISFVTAGYLMVVWFEALEGTPLGLPIVSTLTKITLIVAVLAVGIVFSTSKIVRGERNDAIAMGIWMRANLPTDARIYQVDLSGFPAYFSERSVINGDGLINGWEYQDSIRSGNLVDYLKKYGVRYMIWTKYEGEPRIEISVRLWTETSHSLSFTEEPEQLARFGSFVLLKVDLSSVVVTRP